MNKTTKFCPWPCHGHFSLCLYCQEAFRRCQDMRLLVLFLVVHCRKYLMSQKFAAKVLTFYEMGNTRFTEYLPWNHINIIWWLAIYYTNRQLVNHKAKKYFGSSPVRLTYLLYKISFISSRRFSFLSRVLWYLLRTSSLVILFISIIPFLSFSRCKDSAKNRFSKEKENKL